MHSLTRSCFCFRRLLLKSACKAWLHYSRQLGSFFLPPRRSRTRFSRTPMAHNGGPAQVAGWCDDKVTRWCSDSLLWQVMEAMPGSALHSTSEIPFDQSADEVVVVVKRFEHYSCFQSYYITP